MFFKKLFGILKIVILVVLILLLVFNLFIIAAQVILKDDMPKVFGYARVIVVSGSMSPAVEIGDMLIIREADKYITDDIITFRSGESYVTHRIIGFDEDGRAITKGDFNNVRDASPVSFKDIEGKYVLRIPKFGNVLLFLKTPFGMLIMVITAILLIEVPHISGRIRNRVKNAKQKDSQE